VVEWRQVTMNDFNVQQEQQQQSVCGRPVGYSLSHAFT